MANRGDRVIHEQYGRGAVQRTDSEGYIETRFDRYFGSICVPPQSLTPEYAESAILRDPDEEARARAIPGSKREAAEQHAAAGIGPDAKTEHQKRKDQPVARGVLDYFPDALFAVAEISRIGNEQHNPGQPMHWAYGKSMDHADCCVRHLADRGELDSDGALHDAKAAWRALANLQTWLEKQDPELHKRREAQRRRAASGER